MDPGLGSIHGGVSMVGAVSVCPNASLILMPVFFVEIVEYGGVECFSCRGAIFQSGKVVSGKIFVDDKPIDGWRRTKRCNFILRQHTKYIFRYKFPLVVVNKYASAHNPLPVEFAPDGFCPTGIGNGEVYALFVQVVPIFGGGNVSQRVGVVVNYHLSDPKK